MVAMIAGQIAAAFAIQQSKNRSEAMDYETSSKIEAMDSETTVERYSRYLQDMNTGVMSSLQADPNNKTGACNDKTAETNQFISDMFDGPSYPSGEITQAEFGEKF